jgi:hypothetical protein
MVTFELLEGGVYIFDPHPLLPGPTTTALALDPTRLGKEQLTAGELAAGLVDKVLL